MHGKKTLLAFKGYLFGSSFGGGGYPQTVGFKALAIFFGFDLGWTITKSKFNNIAFNAFYLEVHMEVVVVLKRWGSRTWPVF